MSRIETTAIFEGLDHLRLDKPVDQVISGHVRVIVLYGDSVDETVVTSGKVNMPDFAAMRRGVFGEKIGERMLTGEDSEFIRDRGQW